MMTPVHAKALYKAGFKKPEDLANASVVDVQEALKVPSMISLFRLCGFKLHSTEWSWYFLVVSQRCLRFQLQAQVKVAAKHGTAGFADSDRMLKTGALASDLVEAANSLIRLG
jgi:hypothetical protein